MASREYLLLVEEVSYGIPATKVVGTNAFYARLDDGNSFTCQMEPIFLPIMYGGGRATPALEVNDQFNCKGTFKTKLYAGPYSAMLCNWAWTPINAGRTAPWTTTDAAGLMPLGDLASLSAYHAFEDAAGNYQLKRMGGMKALNPKISCSRSSPIATFSTDFVCQRDDLKGDGSAGYPDATEFPPPAETDYPSNPYTFHHTGGNFNLGGTSGSPTVRTQYSSLDISSANVVDPRWFESSYLIFARFLGRTSTLTSELHLKFSPDDLATLQTISPGFMSAEFNNGTHSLKWTYNAKNFITGLARNLPLNQVYSRTATVTNFWDPTAANDLVFSST